MASRGEIWGVRLLDYGLLPRLVCVANSKLRKLSISFASYCAQGEKFGNLGLLGLLARYPLMADLICVNPSFFNC